MLSRYNSGQGCSGMTAKGYFLGTESLTFLILNWLNYKCMRLPCFPHDESHLAKGLQCDILIC